MHGLLKKLLFLLLIGFMGLSLSSWELHYPEDYPYAQYQLSLPQNKAQTPPPYDYGDRTQLSAFLLCLFLGFVSAHHFYLKNRKIAFIQLGMFLLMILAYASFTAIGGLLGALLALTLFGWIVADLLLICFGGIRPKSRRPLIPWD